jgi:hypothetical protein
MWNGAAEILKASAVQRNTSPKVRPRLAPSASITCAMTSNRVEPV